MVDSVHPTQEPMSSQMTSGVIKWAASSDWVVPAGEDYLAGFDGLSGTPLNGFQESHSASSFDVDIDTGEAFVGGRWMARDDAPTTITLDSGQSNQTVYAGWESSTANSVVIGLDSAFSSTDDGRRTAIWEFNTDGSGVTSSTNVHDTEPIHPHAADADALAGVDASDYARTDLSETISPFWTFNSGLGANGNVSMNSNAIQDASNVDSDRFLLDSSGYGLNFGVGGSNDDRPFIAPYINGSSNFGREITWMESNDRWEIEGGLHVPDGAISDGRGDMVVSGIQRHIFVAGSSPSSSDGGHGDIWLEY